MMNASFFNQERVTGSRTLLTSVSKAVSGGNVSGSIVLCEKEYQ
jgi:hypothetical protein